MEITDILLGILAVILSLAFTFLRKYVNSKVSSEASGEALFWVTKAVQAAEQVFKDTPRAGDDKYEYACGLLDDISADTGLKLTDSQKHTLIEAAVEKLNEDK